MDEDPRFFPHHARLAERAAERYSGLDGVDAVVVGGSVAHGVARPDSDLDLLLVVADAAAARHPPTFTDAELADYEGGYVDVKVVTRSFLAEVAERGSEPARWAFEGAVVAWSRDPAVDAALAAAAAYPESERAGKLHDFVCHTAIAAWYLGEAEKRRDPYLTLYASSRAVLYAGRAVLAHNRLLFPFHKWFLHRLHEAAERPEGFLAQISALLRAPRTATAWHLSEGVQELTGDRPTMAECAASFMRRTEWSWRRGGAPFDES
jgi:predicted nucleotidyltransferase